MLGNTGPAGCRPPASLARLPAAFRLLHPPPRAQCYSISLGAQMVEIPGVAADVSIRHAVYVFFNVCFLPRRAAPRVATAGQSRPSHPPIHSRRVAILMRALLS